AVAAPAPAARSSSVRPNTSALGIACAFPEACRGPRAGEHKGSRRRKVRKRPAGIFRLVERPPQRDPQLGGRCCDLREPKPAKRIVLPTDVSTSPSEGDSGASAH